MSLNGIIWIIMQHSRRWIWLLKICFWLSSTRFLKTSSTIKLLMAYQLSSVLSNYLHKKEYKFGKHSKNESRDLINWTLLDMNKEFSVNILTLGFKILTCNFNLKQK